MTKIIQRKILNIFMQVFQNIFVSREYRIQYEA